MTLHRAQLGAGDGDLIVTYHYVRPCNSEGVTGITPAEFDEQLAAIGREHRFVTVHEFLGPRRPGERPALITFDDAVRDQYDHAAEVLARHGAPAVFYAPMRPYSDEADRWCPQHLLHALAQELGFEELEQRVRRIAGGVHVDEAEMNRLYHYEVPEKRWLKYAMAFALPAAESAAILREINDSLGLPAEEWYMTAAQLAELQSAGHSLGGHGFDHLPYSTLTPMQQAADMHRAVALMNRLFGAMPRTLAYPFGRFDAATEAIARGCGYTHMFTTDDRIDAKDLSGRLGAMV